MSGFNEIATARLRLRPFTAADVTPAYLAWLNDRDLMRFSDQRFRTHTAESCTRYLAGFAGSPSLFLAVETRGDGRCIGTMTAHVDPNHGRADLGILMGEPAARGRGYGREAWVGVMRHLFEARGLRKLTAGMIAENVAMVRLAEGAGMQPDGVRRRQNLIEGREVDVVYYAAFRATWTPPSG
jgi:RimJ/RimL family protein N-acetyltransferase